MLRLPLFATCVFACLLALSAAARAATLSDVTVSKQEYYLEVKLSFDSKPTYSESFRYGPDRYVLSLENCKSSVPKTKLDSLAKVDSKLLTRISVAPSGSGVSLGFYLNLPVQPLVRYDEKSYYLRFYTGSRAERVTALAPGVALVEKTVAQGDQNLAFYMLRLDPGAQAELFAAAADRYDGTTRVRRPTSFARKESALAVLNGGFFGAKGQHLGTLVEDGVVRATGVIPTRPMLVIGTDGGIQLGRFNVVTQLRFGGKALKINAKNYPFKSGNTIVYDHTYPLDTLPQEAMYYYTITGGKMKFYASSTKGLTLAPGTLLLANDIIPEANPLRQIAETDTVSLETLITDPAGNKVTAQSVIGGAPMLVENGAVNLSSEEDRVRDDIAKSERSRTAVALTKSGQLLLVVVKEAEGAGFGGVTLTALGNLLVKEGAVSAMNLDGGGSSALVVAGELLNGSEKDERPVSNVLVVK
jgi:exopolysaccharide biosynthesis protein